MIVRAILAFGGWCEEGQDKVCDALELPAPPVKLRGGAVSFTSSAPAPSKTLRLPATHIWPQTPCRLHALPGESKENPLSKCQQNPLVRGWVPGSAQRWELSIASWECGSTLRRLQ